MGVQIVTVQYQVDTGDLEDSRDIVRQIARELNVTEDQVSEINGELQQQTGILGKLRQEEQRLLRLREQSQSEDQIRELNRELEQTRGRMRELTGETRRTAGGFRNLGKMIKGALAVTAIAAFAKQAIGLAAEMESLTIQFEQFAGSTENAKKLLGEVEAFAASTPFQFENLAQAARNMLAFGIAQEDVLPNLRKLGDLAAGSGNDVGELAELFGKAKVQGRLFAEDINQFLERGIPIVKGLAEAMGVTEQEVKNLVSTGKVGFEQLEGAVEALAGETGQYFGLTEKLSKSTSGQLSTLKDNFASLARSIGDILLPVVNLLAGALNVVIGAAKAAVNAISGLFDKTDFLAAFNLKQTREILAEFNQELGLTNSELVEFDAFLQKTNFNAAEAGIDGLREAYENWRKSIEDANVKAREAEAEQRKQAEAAAIAAKSIGGLRKQLKELNAAYESAGTDAERKRILAQIRAINAQIAAIDGRKESISKQAQAASEAQRAMELLNKQMEDFVELSQLEGPIEQLPDKILTIISDAQDTLTASLQDTSFVDPQSIRSDFEAVKDAYRDTANFIRDESISVGDEIVGFLSDNLEGFQTLATSGLEIASNVVTAIFNKQEAELAAAKASELARFGTTEEAKARINEKFAAEEQRLREERAKQEKRLAIFETIINTAAAIVKALAVGNIPLSILAAAVGASQLAVIESQQFAEGVIDLKGPGTGTSDDIPAWLSRGESVMTAKETKQFRPVLDAIRGKKINPVLLNEFVKGNLTLAGQSQGLNMTPMLKGLNRIEKTIKGLQIHNTVIDERGVRRWMSSQDSYNYYLNKAANG